METNRTSTPLQAVDERARVIAWLQSLGDKFLGDGVRDSMRASSVLSALLAPLQLDAGMQTSDQVHLVADGASDESLQPLLDAQSVLAEVAAERERQDMKWGGPDHDDGHTTADFVQLIQDYAGWARVMAGMNSPDKARRRMVQIAALEVAEVQRMDRIALGNRTPARQEAERECETCRGVGTMDERLGGEFFSNPAATCPDCDGKGWWVATPRKQETQATGEDAITLAFRLYGEDLDTFAPETRAVMDKLRPIVAERLGMAASGESESAAPLPVQGQDEAARLKAAGFDLDSEFDRPSRNCYCELCLSYYAALRASIAPTTKG